MDKNVQGYKGYAVLPATVRPTQIELMSKFELLIGRTNLLKLLTI